VDSGGPNGVMDQVSYAHCKPAGALIDAMSIVAFHAPRNLLPTAVHSNPPRLPRNIHQGWATSYPQQITAA